MRRRSLLLLAPLAAVASTATGAHAQPPVRVTVVGDSVAAALQYAPEARRTLGRGYDVRFDLRVCRRLAAAGCPYQGTVPSSALDAVSALGAGLGRVLVVDVGYNDDPARYRRDMDELVRAADANGVERIVWVTLKETRDVYARTNAVIRGEAARLPDVEVADWNGSSRGRPWFRQDGLHLTADGAEALAAFLRPYVVEAAGATA